MRRFTRLTNAFSKKFENHVRMVALYTVWYSYVEQHPCRWHQPDPLAHDGLSGDH
jgi:hypothetical protein